MNVREIIPEHTERGFMIKEMSFINIDIDSLNDLTYAIPVLEIDIQSNNNFAVHGLDVNPHYGKKFKMSNMGQAMFLEEREHIEMQEVAYNENPRIGTIRNQIALIQSKNTKRATEQATRLAKLESLEQYITTLEDLYEKDKAFEEIRQLKKELKSDEFENSRVAELEAQIRELRKLDRLKYNEKKSDAMNEYNEKKQRATVFTGFIKFAQLDTAN